MRKALKILGLLSWNLALIGLLPSGGLHAALTAPGEPRSSLVQKYLDGQALPPTGHALLIGINKYREWAPLEWPRGDVEQIAAVLRRHYGFEDVRLLCDEAATRENILKELEHLAGTLTERDALVIYYAGRGYSRGPMYDAFWVPADGRFQASTARAEEQWISNNRLKGCLAKLRTSQVLVISDSCFSPTMLFRQRKGAAGETNGHSSAEASNRSWWCLSSGYMEEVPAHSSFGERLIGQLLAPRQAAFTVLELAEWLRGGLTESSDSSVLVGAINSAATRPGNDFVFMRNEARPMLPSPPASQDESQQVAKAAPVKLEASIAGGGLPDQVPGVPGDPATRQLAGPQRESETRLEWDERHLVTRLAEEKTLVPFEQKAPPSPVPEGDADALAKVARERFENDDLDGAAIVYEALLKKRPGDLCASSNLGVVRYNQNRMGEAEKIFRDLLKRDPQDAFSQSMLGMVLSRQKKSDEAIQVLTAAAKSRPDDARLHNFLGIACMQKGKYEAAGNALRKAIQLKPDYADAHYNLALLYLTENPRSVELARVHYQAARKLEMPPDPELENLMKR
jgi:tetratricopeptide (TPR) repeat protein